MPLMVHLQYIRRTKFAKLSERIIDVNFANLEKVGGSLYGSLILASLILKGYTFGLDFLSGRRREIT